MRFVLLSLIFLLTTHLSYASLGLRQVDFEWEPIEGASGYEIEISQKKQKSQLFKTKEAAWNGKLKPGQYTMKIRSLDFRKVPGDWSEESPFDVGLEIVKTVSPQPGAQLKTGQAEESKVKFEWQPVQFADQYEFEITSEDGSFKQNEKLSDSVFNLKVPVAKSYSWKVTALNKDGLKSEQAVNNTFESLGEKLAKPKINSPENAFVRELRWEKSDFADAYDLTVFKKNSASQKWDKVQSINGHQGEKFDFPAEWAGGDYKIQIKAQGARREDSEIAVKTFKVKNGDRSPAAEFIAEVNKSVERINGWYGVASYLISMINYSSVDSINANQPSQIKFNAVGGTGRLGLGWFRPENPWGFLGIIDMSGMIAEDGKNITSGSIEASGIWRRDVGDRGEVRLHGGLFNREMTIAVANPSQQKVNNYSTAKVMGPHVGAEYWYSMSPKLGLQTNLHLYYGMMKMSTPNGQDLIPEMSYQLGFMGSYRLTKRMTGLAGLTYREDKIKYKSEKPNTPNNFAELSGTYINLFAEYDF